MKLEDIRHSINNNPDTSNYIDGEEWDKISSAIAKELMGIIGEDDKQRWDDDDGFCQTCDFTRSDDSKECICILRNQLRAEQRARLTAFIGKEK